MEPFIFCITSLFQIKNIMNKINELKCNTNSKCFTYSITPMYSVIKQPHVIFKYTSNICVIVLLSLS